MPDEPRPDKVGHDQYGNNTGQNLQYSAQSNMPRVGTLDASDYGLLDENTYAPRPNYWAALLWRRLMGTTVLDPGPSPAPALHLYAHSLRGVPGGVSLLVINTDQTASQSLNVGNQFTPCAPQPDFY